MVEEINSKEFIQEYLINLEFIGLACSHLLEHYLAEKYSDSDIKVEQFAKALHMSERNLRRKCLKYFGRSPTELLLLYRIDIAKNLLANNEKASDIALQVGFSSHSHFSTQFKKVMKISPIDYQRKIQKLAES